MRSNIFISIIKIIVTIYTAITIPFYYYYYQKPWKKLNSSLSFDVKKTKDKYGRIIYSRKNSKKNSKNYLFNFQTYSEVLNNLDRNLIKIGRRDIINEELQYDDNGKLITFNGRMLSKIKLTDYKWYTRGEILDRADCIARGLQKIGIKKNDKVMIYAETSLEWFLIALSLQRLLSITTTLFSTLSDSGIVHGLNQSESSYLIIDESLLIKVDKLQDQIKFIKHIIYIVNHPASYKSKDVQVQAAKSRLSNKYKLLSLNEIEKIGIKIEKYEFPIANRDDVMMIMYTSGTTGDPKGVVITHGNFYTSVLNLWGRDLEQYPISISKSDLPVFLPMAHIFGYSTILTFFLSEGRMGFSSPFTLLNSSPSLVNGQVGDINLIKPELFPAVPLVLEKLVSEIYRKLNARSPIAVELFNYLMDYKIYWRSKGFDTPIINRLVCQKINQEFGGRLKALLVTGAAFSERTHSLATAALNLVCIYNMYGSTETTCPMAIMMINDLSYGRTGVPLNDFKYYLEDWHEGGYTTKDEPNPRGEIVVGGPTIALGYYNKPEETEKDFYTDDEGCRWFSTGDIGEVFPDGTLKIIDRKKDLVKLANGEYISLGKIETGLRSSEYVENICVATDPFRNEIIALIMPNRLALIEFSKKINLKHNFQQLCDDPLIINEVLRSIQEKTLQLGFKKRENPTKIILVKEEWTQDNNMLTAASKMRRKTVMDFYKETIKKTFHNLSTENDDNLIDKKNY